MKHKYIKFLKDHKSGFKTGQVVKIPEVSLNVWVESGYAEEVTKKEYTKWFNDNNKALAAEKKDAMKKHQEKIDAVAEQNNKSEEESNSEDLGNENTPSGTGGVKTEESSSEPLKHTLTQQDLIDNTELTEGFEVGDEIEVNENDEWLVDEHDKLIKLN